MSTRRLTPTSYLVLGLVAELGPVTSYQLKRRVQESIGYFWSFPHSQLYAEPERLVGEGLLRQTQEETGRRRRRFTIAARGREALAAWLREPARSPTELRDLGLLKLFFGTLAGPEQVVVLAREQRERHAEQRATYEAMWTRGLAVEDPNVLATLEIGLRFEAMQVDFWSEVERNPTRQHSGRTSGRRKS